MPQRPNVLFIFPDQWRGDCIGATGHPVVETPFLDDMAHTGVTFTSCYTQCPSCIATRASLATGRTPNSTGRIGYQDRVPWRYEATMMHRLRDSGYQTLCAGKTHFYPQRLHLGFEEMRLYDVQQHDPHYVSDYHAWLQQQTGGSVTDTAHEITSNSWMARAWEHEEALHPNTWTAEAAIELMSRRDPTRPFFLQVGFHRPHPPLDPPVEYFGQYEGRKLPPVPVGDWAQELGDPVTAVDASTGTLPEHILSRTRWAYYAQITHLDYQIGRMLHWLRRRGWLSETWVIFMSDHGELLGDHHRFRKVLPLEGSAHVPLIAMPPQSWEGERGIVREEPVAHLDIMPTILQQAGLPVPDDVEGLSLAPLMRGEDASWREFLHGEHAGFGGYGHQFVTDGREKYVWFTQTGRELFFDLAADPQELHDRSDDPAYAERVELWRQRLISVLAERPEDGLTDGEQLISGKSLPAVREWLLEE
ncbi:MAG: arylsulfatase [Armatimonadota bacterium]|nr:arylsulfatase [Armatimonadota bacterium]